ncbi:hypothetical protein CBL_06331 [Carabus blaptoides fortunei]
MGRARIYTVKRRIVQIRSQNESDEVQIVIPELSSQKKAQLRVQLDQMINDLQVHFTPGTTNIVADTLSRSPRSDDQGNVCLLTAYVPIWTAEYIRNTQLEDPEIAKIIESLEAVTPTSDYYRWVERGYILSKGVLYGYVPENESDEVQLVILDKERLEILKKYKAITQKSVGLLQTPVYNRRFEVVAIDLFGPLLETELAHATDMNCAKILIDEVISRYGVSRRIISGNGAQFVREIMQQICYVFNITQSLSSTYHPQSNSVERKNRNLKPQLAIQVGMDHHTWNEKLATIRFAMNSSVTQGTGYAAISPLHFTTLDLKESGDCNLEIIAYPSNQMIQLTLEIFGKAPVA